MQSNLNTGGFVYNSVRSCSSPVYVQDNNNEKQRLDDVCLPRAMNVSVDLSEEYGQSHAVVPGRTRSARAYGLSNETVPHVGSTNMELSQHDKAQARKQVPRFFRCPFGQLSLVHKQASCLGPGWNSSHRLK
jgi:hypothetical protein